MCTLLRSLCHPLPWVGTHCCSCCGFSCSALSTKPSKSLDLIGESSWAHPSLAEGGGIPRSAHSALCPSPFSPPSPHAPSLLTLLIAETTIQLLFSHSVASESLQPHGLQHARLSCPFPSPGVCSNSCPLSDVIQPSHPLLYPSVSAFNLSQHQGLF